MKIIATSPSKSALQLLEKLNISTNITYMHVNLPIDYKKLCKNYEICIYVTTYNPRRVFDQQKEFLNACIKFKMVIIVMLFHMGDIDEKELADINIKMEFIEDAPKKLLKKSVIFSWLREPSNFQRNTLIKMLNVGI